MSTKRKDKDNGNETSTKNKRIREEKCGDFSDDDLSDIEEGGEMFNGIRIPAELPPIVSAKEKPGPRMVITKIVVNNFKSYYGEVTIGPFHKSLTSIVGANGSGKSNVIDSLLFVFGYRSTKIRSKKVSVLLHKSDQHKDVRQCSVTVHFVHTDDNNTQEMGYSAIPGSEISITRTAFKDNTSYYTLNNKRVKFKDIAVMLMKNGIDLIHNRFLILQGEVEQIAMMKPKSENEHSTGMLEYLEDVIGTVRYKKPITKLEEKVKDLSLEKNEKITRLKFVAKEREELIEPAETVVRSLKMENLIALVENKILQQDIHYCNKLYDVDYEACNKIKDQLKSIETELEDIAENKKNKEAMLRSLAEKLKSNAAKSNQLSKKNENHLQEEVNLKANISQAESQIKKYENSIKQEQKKITKANGVPKIKEAEYELLNSQIEPLEKECTKLEILYTKVNSNGFEKSKKFREEKDSLASEETQLQKLVGKKQNQFQTLKTEFEVLLDTEKSETQKLCKLEEQLTKGVDENQDNIRNKEKAEVDICTYKKKIKEAEKDIEKLKKDEQQFKEKLQNIRQSLSEKRTAYAETTERSRPIQYILSLKDKGEISGILGRCGDYGQVEGKLDVPASTACGSTDQIVVETSKAAHECIAKLRKYNIGRLTFSILPHIQKLKPRADAINNYPENTKRVFDFIQMLDQRFRLTFYSGLYDTLLAENLEQARRIAFGTKSRYRVVTFKGDLIDQSGIMSGGGRPIKGKIGPQETKSRFAGGNISQVSQNDVEKLDKIAKELEDKLGKTQSCIFELHSTIDQHQRQIEELNIIIRQCSSRINAWKEKENQVNNLIKAQKLVIVKKKTDPIAVANKETEIKKAEKELEEAEVEYNKIKTKMDKLKVKIEEITEGEPKKAKLLLDEAIKKLEDTRSAINQVNVDIKAAERQLKKSEHQIENFKNDIDELKKKIQIFNEKLATNKNLTSEIQKTISEIKANMEEQKKNIEEIKTKDDESIKRSNELRKNEIILKQEEEDFNIKIKTHEENIKDFKIALSKLKLHKIPELDCVQRDPITESYQTKSHNKPTLDKKNDNKLSDKNAESLEKNPDQMQVDVKHRMEDDDSDAYLEEFPVFNKTELEELSKNDLNLRKMTLSENLVEKIPSINILEEYRKRTLQYHEKADEVAVVMELYNSHIDILNKVRHRRRDEFIASFKKITLKLKEMYQMITLGGDAELELVDSLDPFSEGVNFSVRPPKKTWKVISNLSGGEKTLSSLALVFALHYYKPSPLYVMDEIDAALDFKNVSIIAYYIKERTKNSQFIIISLRSNMFEKANLLVGIYKTSDCTECSPVVTNDYLKLFAGPLSRMRAMTMSSFSYVPV